MGSPLGHGERRVGPHHGELGLGLLPFVAQRKAEKDMAIELCRFVQASRHLVCPGQGQLKVCVAGDGVGCVFAEHLQRRLGIVLIEGEVGDHHGQTADENALRIFCGKTSEQGLRIRELAGFHQRLGSEKISIVVHGLTQGVRFLEAGGCVRVAVIQ